MTQGGFWPLRPEPGKRKKCLNILKRNELKTSNGNEELGSEHF
jgi:hypothetical protein